LSPKAKLWFIRWIVFEVLVIAIALTHFILSPYAVDPYAKAAYVIILASVAALFVAFVVYRKRLKRKQQ